MDMLEQLQIKFDDLANLTDAGHLAQCCHEGLRDILSFIFDFQKVEIPYNASLLELIDAPTTTVIIGDKELIDAMHYVRILGVNALHGNHIKLREAKLALENLRTILDFIKYKLSPEAQHAPYQKMPYMSEAATRRLYIDLYLKEAGWEILEQENVALPSKAGIEIKVEGMPNSEGVGFCDYVLYGRDGKPLAVVEAKKTSVAPEVGRHQVQLYGECLQKQYGVMPVLYYTNGYSIKCIDGLYPDRDLLAFHTLAELELLIQRRSRKDITDLRIREDITDRPYQRMAITNICARLNKGFRRGLLVMATGTGKTRVAISLVDILARNQWIKNVLFLADRTSLVSQAHKNFQKLLPDQSFCVLSDHRLNQDLNARIMFSTYQTMINYVDGEEKKFSSGRFDLILVDEAHRSIFNKYGAIFSYFDSLLIGLTATPKSEVDANTYRIFGCESGTPNFDYSLKEAVKDHYLTPYKVVNRTTRLLDRGAKYSDLSPEEKKHVEEAFADAPPEMGYDIRENQLFRQVYNNTTCDRVLQDLMEKGLKVESGDKLGKTIIFAYNHTHAQMIVECFHRLYPHLGADFCQLIDNYVKYADDLIKKFEKQPNFQIAVSVDMLDTGIDVPSVLNLVFFKPVKSKIKFIQMIGRGTRLCPDVFGAGKDKELFYIFDYCGNFAYFDEHPDKVDPIGALSITQRLFNLRLAILLELQRAEHQEHEFHQAYYSKLREMLHHDIVSIKSQSARLQVRLAMPYVDKYCDKEIWQQLSPINQKEIEIHLTPLLDAVITESELMKIFDARMLNIELSVLVTGKTGKAKKDVQVIREVCQHLLTKASVPQIMARVEQLNTLVSEQFWAEPQIKDLESLREELRDLMKFLEDGGNKPIIIHIDDDIEDAGEVEGDLIDIRTYRQKVLEYLKEHLNSPVLRKIANLENINESDLRELEDILWNQLGTKEEYEKEAKQDNLAVFVRSLIGLNQDAINKKFGEFLSGNILTPAQQEFVKAIIDYVRENGNIRLEDLLQKTPFANYDVGALFGDKISVVKQIIEIVQHAVTIAA